MQSGHLPSVTEARRFNISPTQIVPVILNTKPDQIEFAHWGIIPAWDKTGKKTIITIEPNGIVSKVHDRMQAILRPEAEADWLNFDTTLEQALELLQTYPGGEMKTHEIYTLFNSPANDTPAILQPLNSL